MECISKKRCTIGEGPIWNEKERLLYFVNAFENEICMLDISTGDLKVRENAQASAIAFDTDNRLIVSTKTGVYYLNDDNSYDEIYDVKKYKTAFCNDMKVGPDGRIYVGTQTSKRLGISSEIDGKLYRIDKNGNVTVLLDNLILSNGMDWSMYEKLFYHTDSDTGIIKEYDFDKSLGTLSYTGRSVKVGGVDGFTIDKNDNILATCWGYGRVAVIDKHTMEIVDYIEVPAQAPASCGFCGEDMNKLAVVTATYDRNLDTDIYAGFTFLKEMEIGGRLPYLFGGKY